MLQKIRLYLFITIIPICLSSCFQIIEEVNLNKNGSGNAKLTINLSSSKTKLASIMLLDSINGYKVPSRATITQHTNDIAAYLKNIKGTSNIKYNLDFEKFIGTISFSFQNVSSLSSINQRVLKELKITSSSKSSYTYNPETYVFQRNYSYVKEANKQFNEMKAENRKIFREASYVNIYRFENPVKTISNPLATPSKSRKAVMFKTGIMDLINGKTNLSNTITF